MPPTNLFSRNPNSMPDSRVADYYEVLQLSSRADRDTIERVFRLLAKRFHPDNKETGDGDRFSELVEAYDVLSDPEQRAKYDANYERVREARWRLFDQDAATSEVAADRRIRLAILSVLYVARRNDPIEPGIGIAELERLLGCAEQIVRFHIWYLRENGWLERLTSGHFAITAPGVDRLFELGGPAKAGPQLLKKGATPTANAEIAANE